MQNYTASTLNRRLKEPVAQYPLNTGESNTAKDILDHYDCSIINGEWQFHQCVIIQF